MDYTERQANRDAFRGLIKQTSIPLTNASIAQFLGISESYAEQLWGGSKPMSGPVRASINKILGNSPAPLSPLNQAEPVVESKHVLEQGEIKERDPVCGPIGFGAGFRVEGVPGGGYRITQTVAECVDQAFARAICELLNKEAG